MTIIKSIRKFQNTLFFCSFLLILTFIYKLYDFDVRIDIYGRSETLLFVNRNNGKTVYLGDLQRTCYTTVVTTLFLFGKSKHSREDYDRWSNTMIKSIGAPIVAIVDFNWEKKFIERARLYNLTGIVYITESIWDIMTEFEKKRKKNYTNEYKEKQLLLDREKNLHSAELYAVWNLKTYILNQVAKVNPFKSEFFIYTDSGAWRGSQFNNWPDESFIPKVRDKIQDRILYGQVGYDPKDNNLNFDIIQGTFIAGTSLAIANIYNDFYNLHDEWLDKGRFVGKDQYLMNELAFKRANSTIARLRAHSLNCNGYYNKWFFYQYFFSRPNEYICHEDRRSLLMISREFN